MKDNNIPLLLKPLNDEDIQSQEEINEKPYYNTGSAPTNQNTTDNGQAQNQIPVNNPPPYYDPNNNIQPQYPNQNNMQAPIYNPNNNQPSINNPNNNQPPYNNPNNNQPQYYPPQGTPQQVNQTYPGSGPYYPPPINYNNKNYNKDINSNSQSQVEIQRELCLRSPKTGIFLSILLIFVVILDIIVQNSSEFIAIILIDDAILLTIAIIFLILICKGKSVVHRAFGAVMVIVLIIGIFIRLYGIGVLREYDEALGFFYLSLARTIILMFFVLITCNRRRNT